jgi:hypothetical protein
MAIVLYTNSSVNQHMAIVLHYQFHINLCTNTTIGAYYPLYVNLPCYHYILAIMPTYLWSRCIINLYILLSTPVTTWLQPPICGVVLRSPIPRSAEVLFFHVYLLHYASTHSTQAFLLPCLFALRARVLCTAGNLPPALCPYCSHYASVMHYARCIRQLCPILFLILIVYYVNYVLYVSVSMTVIHYIASNYVLYTFSSL